VIFQLYQVNGKTDAAWGDSIQYPQSGFFQMNYANTPSSFDRVFVSAHHGSNKGCAVLKHGMKNRVDRTMFIIATGPGFQAQATIAEGDVSITDTGVDNLFQLAFSKSNGLFTMRINPRVTI